MHVYVRARARAPHCRGVYYSERRIVLAYFTPGGGGWVGNRSLRFLYFTKMGGALNEGWSTQRQNGVRPSRGSTNIRGFRLHARTRRLGLSMHNIVCVYACIAL